MKQHRQPFFVTFFYLVWLLVFGPGCAALSMADLVERNPHALSARICDFPAGLPNNIRLIAYRRASGKIVTNADEMELKLAAYDADALYELDRSAPESSIKSAPAEWHLQCPKRGSPSPDVSVGLRIMPPCPEAVSEQSGGASDTRRPDPSLLGQTNPSPRSPWLQPLRGAAFAPDCYTLIRDAQKAEVRRILLDIGQRVALVVEDSDENLRRLNKATEGSLKIILARDPTLAEELQNYVAMQLNAIPDPPMYDDAELAGIAQHAFDEGYGVGANQVQLKFAIFDAKIMALEYAILSLPALAERVSLTALELALTRLRRMPMFIPGAAGGAGFFLRLPKARLVSTATSVIETRVPATLPAVRLPSGPPPSVPVVKPPPVAEPAPPVANVSTNVANVVTGTITRVKPDGQLHHAISEKVFKALEDHPNLKGVFKFRDSQFTARAATLKDHNGYQKWHEALDDEVAKFITDNRDLDPKKFASWLGKRYRKPDLVKRFPGGLGANK